MPTNSSTVPVVEAEIRLLPDNMNKKIDSYLRLTYDEVYEIINLNS